VETKSPAARPLQVPAVDPAHYGANFIRLAVCELRFPTLFEIEADRPPAAFARALRKTYPNHERAKNVNVNPAGLEQATAHIFHSKKNRWQVTLRASALSIETSSYDKYAEFEERVQFVIDAAKSTIDSDFFTRVGLRYINVIPYQMTEISEWVNSALVAPLGAGTFGDVDECWQQVRGTTDIGGYSFRHGVNANRSAPAAGAPSEYVLDFDFFCEDVQVSDALEIVSQLHEREYAMFDWTLGPKMREQLGASKLKGKP